MHKKLNSFVYQFVVNLQGFLNNSIMVHSYKAENWHALSHEQYFWKHNFLDICQCTLD